MKIPAASPWVQRWAHLVAPGGAVLDVACGGGRHLRWFAERGHPVTGVDIDITTAPAQLPHTRLIAADIENAPWPLSDASGRPEQFAAIVVTNYLWRPLLPTLVASLVPGGVLLYETFSQGNASVGRPARPDFLLQPGELLQACAGLDTVAYECGFLDQPARFVQRIAAVCPAQTGQPDRLPAVYRL